jgi:nitrile hydratase accessory protein
VETEEPAIHAFDPVGLPRDAEGPVFDQPWQAHAFALVMQLHRAGAFTWEEWVRVFSREIATAPAQPGERVNDAYYRQWLAALEEIVTLSGLSDRGAMAERADEWRQAYLNTPHGQPIDLANARCSPDHAHNHAHMPQRGPVATAPSTSKAWNIAK